MEVTYIFDSVAWLIADTILKCSSLWCLSTSEYGLFLQTAAMSIIHQAKKCVDLSYLLWDAY